MRRIATVIFLFFIWSWLSAQVQAVGKYPYVTFPNDPLKARIYTLSNGLKVYMTVYKDKPRIQTYVVVRAGSKNDPEETTGLAHYFEHMMFKGTPHFGTMDYEKEKVYIDKVDSLFEVYRKLTDPKQRKATYKIIDSLSYLASKYAIPNEYDKLMNILGSEGTNAFTSYEMTVYVENIPSNQLENWAKIQADRFMYPVLRGFHTELETIYEEKNMTLTNDSRKTIEALFTGLFQKHPYRHPVIGYAEHIKNPSMRNIRWFHANYYVPNNMAIAISGDFDPDEAIKIIDKYFGQMKPVDYPSFTPPQEEPIKEPIVKKVLGPDAESVTIGFRLPGAFTDDALKLELLDMMLSNSMAGLLDLNLNKQQKVLRASSSAWIMKDYSILMLSGRPKQGQTLDEVKQLLLEQLEKVKKGEFDDELIPAIITNMKVNEMRELEDNSNRAMKFVEAFILDIPWDQYIHKTDIISKFTKKDMMEFAQKYFNNNYVVVYKEVGTDTTIKKIPKNKLTKLEMNRDVESEFLKEIKNAKIPEIEPRFVDFKNDLTTSSINNKLPIYYVQNNENNLFTLYFVFDMGSNHNKALPVYMDFVKYLGTQNMTAEEVSKKLFSLGCEMSASATQDRCYIKLTGLQDNFEEALTILESVFKTPSASQEDLQKFIDNTLKMRVDAKKNMQRTFTMLFTYGMYGEKNPATNILSEKELKKLSLQTIYEFLSHLFNYEHYVMYYGPENIDKIKNIIAQKHSIPTSFKPLPKETKFEPKPTTANTIYYVNFETPQSLILLLSREEKGFNPELYPTIRLFNEYFGGNMNSVVFQEMREARALAYTAIAYYMTPHKKDDYHFTLAYIGTQYDKMETALDAFLQLLSNMPQAEKSFQIAKEGLLKSIRANRVTKDDILWEYLSAKDLGLDYDIEKTTFEKVPSMTLQDLVNFQNSHMKDNKYTILIVGNKKDIPFNELKKFGKIKEVNLKTIFGY